MFDIGRYVFDFHIPNRQVGGMRPVNAVLNDMIVYPLNYFPKLH